jgi:hypothetical protein
MRFEGKNIILHDRQNPPGLRLDRNWNGKAESNVAEHLYLYG